MHTAGPWHVTSAGYVSSDAQGYVPIVTPFTEDAHRDKYRGPTPEALANAHLIASAPALLEALEAFEQASHEQEPTALAMRIDTAAQQARIALAAAKGE